MATEIEPRYFIDRDQFLQIADELQLPKKEIIQGYFAAPVFYVDGTKLHVELTAKDLQSGGNIGFSVEVPEDEIDQLRLTDPDKLEKRIRITDGKKAKFTCKTEKVDGAGAEFEYEIPLYIAEPLMDICKNIVEKTRYDHAFSGFTWEVDFFKGRLDGLQLAEVELKSKDERPAKPDYIRTEITNDKRYANRRLANTTPPLPTVNGFYQEGTKLTRNPFLPPKIKGLNP